PLDLAESDVPGDDRDEGDEEGRDERDDREDVVAGARRGRGCVLPAGILRGRGRCRGILSRRRLCGVAGLLRSAGGRGLVGHLPVPSGKGQREVITHWDDTIKVVRST